MFLSIMNTIAAMQKKIQQRLMIFLLSSSNVDNVQRQNGRANILLRNEPMMSRCNSECMLLVMPQPEQYRPVSSLNMHLGNQTLFPGVEK